MTYELLLGDGVLTDRPLLGVKRSIVWFPMPSRISHILFCPRVWIPPPYIQCFQRHSECRKQLLLSVMATDISFPLLCQAKTRQKTWCCQDVTIWKGAKWLYTSYFYTDPNVNMKKIWLVKIRKVVPNHKQLNFCYFLLMWLTANDK